MPRGEASDADTPRLDGFLVIDKPAGWTSHDVVARARRLTGERRIGHAGTLDPAATGVLPLAVGSATRVLEFFSSASKTYLAEITFGVETDSQDVDGVVTAIAGVDHLTEADITAILPAFLGSLDQVPPMHSAIKIGGERLYERARRGEEIDRPPRAITIAHLEVVFWERPVVSMVVDCSKGTYIRALARDMGNALGVGAYLSNLVRLRTGPFTLCQSMTLDDLAVSGLPWAWPTVAWHPDAVIADWPAVLLDDPARRDWLRGNPIAGPAAPEGWCRAYDERGAWLGVGAGDERGGDWLPRKVIADKA